MSEDDDLSRLGMSVNNRRVDKDAGARLADDGLTRAYLEAGLRLLGQELLGQAASDGPWEHPLRILSRKMIVQQARMLDEKTSTVPGDGSFRDRWPKQSDYVADLVRYSMRPKSWEGELGLADAALLPLSTGTRFSDVVHAIARQDTSLANKESVAMRFHLVATALAGRYTAVLGALTDVYAIVTKHWQATYSSLFAARRIRLRPELSAHELTIMLTALSEGLNKRYLGDRESTALLVDERTKRTLLGKAALLLVAGAVDPGDGLTVEQYVDRIFIDPGPPSD